MPAAVYAGGVHLGLTAIPAGLPVGTDTITIVAVNPDGLVSAPSNSFTGLFTTDC